jgi:hypothetical protein
MEKAVIAFDKEVSPRVQEIVDELRQKLIEQGIQLEAIGGGVKNPK